MTAEDQASLHRNAANVQAALDRAGLPGPVQQLTASARTATEAAQALGVPTAAIVNSLVFMADDRPILMLASGARRVDLTALAAACSARAVRRATPDEVRAATGQPIGGVSPVGHPRPVPTYIDVALEEHERVYAAAGTPHTVFPVTYDELLRVCDAVPVDVAVQPE